MLIGVGTIDIEALMNITYASINLENLRQEHQGK